MQRGFRDKLDNSISTASVFDVEISLVGPSVYDSSCFGVDSNDKLADDRYMVFFNQMRSPGGEIVLTQGANTSKYAVNLSALPQSIQKLVFTCSIDGSGTMGQISSCAVSIKQGGAEKLTLKLSGSDFKDEKAIIAIEIYKKDSWRIAAVARGFNGGLADLLKNYGGEEATPEPTPKQGSTPAPKPAQAAPPSSVTPPSKVELSKGQKVNLDKKAGAELGEILINLNWTSPRLKKIDLDLGCFCELRNGNKFVIQALGNAFGNLNSEPYVQLDGDDRSGASAGGENLRVNGKKIREIKRLLIFTYIYEGAANWDAAQGVVTVKCPGSKDIIVRMDEYGSKLTHCAIATFENVNNETFAVEKVVRFFGGHALMDKAFGWGFRWRAGRK